METSLRPIDIRSESDDIYQYKNIPLSLINNHVIRLSIMTEPFYWHYHPDSDEAFLAIEGILCIALEDSLVELKPGQLITIPANVKHYTYPKDERSINLTFEQADMSTIKV